MSAASVQVQVGILTISDSSHRGVRPDVSGPALAGHCGTVGWLVIATAVVPDEVDAISAMLLQWSSDPQIQVILTTGGTGITTRDVTPEATRRVIEKELPGVAELMRQRGLEQTPQSVLSRSVVGTLHQTLIVNLPGSPTGAVFSLGVIEHLVPHCVRLLAGDTQHP